MAAVTDKAFNSWLLMPASSFYTRSFAPGLSTRSRAAKRECRRQTMSLTSEGCCVLHARPAGTPERRLFNRPLPVWPRTLEWELWEPTWEKPRGQGKGLPSPHLSEQSCGPQTVYRGWAARDMNAAGVQAEERGDKFVPTS
ncbi:unnamed protein product [Boreogadus saida]